MLDERLAAIGGPTVPILVRRIMKYMFSDELQQLFNWKGIDKLSFEKTDVIHIIYGKFQNIFCW